MFNRSIRLSSLLAIALLAGCGGPPKGALEAQAHLSSGDYGEATIAANHTLAKHPKDAISWRVKIQAAMGRGDPMQATALYRQWTELRGDEDRSAFRGLAEMTLSQGMHASSEVDRVAALRIAGRFSIVDSQTLRERMGDRSELVSATAALLLGASDASALALGMRRLDSESSGVRAKMVLGFGSSTDRDVRARIVLALGDRSANVRRAAVTAVGTWQRKQDQFSLRTIALRDKDARVRARALRSLLDVGTLGMAAFVDQAMQDSYLGARIAVVSLLVKLGDDNIDSDLMRFISSDDLPVALRSAVALHKRTSFDLQPLFERAQASDEWGTRAAALNVVAQCTHKDFALGYARQGSSDLHPEVRLAAARSLLRLGDPKMASSILQQSLDSGDLDIKLIAASDLAKLGDPGAIEFLSQTSRASSREQKKMAIFAHRHAKIITGGLIASLADADIGVRLAAAEVLLSHR